MDVSEHMAYTGTLPCGCVVTVMVIRDPKDETTEWRRHVARELAAAVRRGESIAQRPVEEVRADPAFMRECGPGGRGHR